MKKHGGQPGIRSKHKQSKTGERYITHYVNKCGSPGYCLRIYVLGLKFCVRSVTRSLEEMIAIRDRVLNDLLE